MLKHLAIDLLRQDNYEIILERLPQENWAEYFDRPSGGMS
jgi:hypothetical protein